MGGPSLNRQLKEQIRRRSRELGFALCGITTPDPPPHFAIFQAWLESGRQGGMAYLESARARSARGQPQKLLASCRSILVLAAPYPAPSPPRPDPMAGRLASYAQGNDYHDVLLPKLKALVGFVEEQLGRTLDFRAYTDSGPILERDLAQRAGLGWIGKNTLLIHPQYGSFFFLAEILIDLLLPPDEPFEADRCGTCTRCLQACPTQCILPDRTLDARRCLSYLTIEWKGPLPAELREPLGNWVFGCDVCQEVCPWNQRAQSPSPDAHFLPRGHFPITDLARELALDEIQAAERFRGSPLRRTQREGYRRNVAVALGNSRQPAAVPALSQALRDPLPLIRQHAAWALGRIASAHAQQALAQALPEEGDLGCQQEILGALERKGLEPAEQGQTKP